MSSGDTPEGRSYVSYDDERSIEGKGSYARDLGLGGVIIWEIHEGYLASAAAGRHTPLLAAVAEHLLQ